MDHARVVGILRKADHLPLIKDYLLAVQKANLVAVNEAVNELLIEEDDFSGLRESITTYDNYDQVHRAISWGQRCMCVRSRPCIRRVSQTQRSRRIAAPAASYHAANTPNSEGAPV